MSDPRRSDAAVQELTLLARYAAGDLAAAKALSGLITPKAFALAARMLGDRAEAEDVTQEAMLKLWQVAPSWQNTGAPPSAWMFQVTANMCRDRLRARPRQPVALEPDREPASEAPSTEQSMQSRARLEALYSALATLPDRQRQAVQLRHIEGWANPDIATALEISVEAVESLTARGKRALAKALAEQKEALGLIHGT